MSWIFQNARDSFPQSREGWDEINKTQGNHPLLDSAFVEPLVRHFASEETLLGISDDPEYPGMALMEGGQWGFWQTFQPAQAPIGLILLKRKDNIVKQTQALMKSLPGYALGFAVLQQDPDMTLFEALDQCRKLETLEYIETARLTLTGTFEEYWKKRSKNLVHNLSRQRRRLKERGSQLELVIEREPRHIQHTIQEYGRLEGAGWKAEQGTAITPENKQGRFYQEMLISFCLQDEGLVYRLLLDGKTIACNLCLKRDQTLIILKTTYDESVEGISAGLLLHQDIFQTLFSEGQIKVVEFYGRVLDWHRKWTSDVRTMYHISYYRYNWVAEVRQFLKSFSSSGAATRQSMSKKGLRLAQLANRLWV